MIGVATNRDAWVSGFSKEKVEKNMRSMIDFYNSQLGKEDFPSDPRNISWTRSLKKDASNRISHTFNADSATIYTYRPFTKINLFYDKPFIESPGLWKRLFPTQEHKNIVIAVSGIGQQKPFSPFISDRISDLQVVDKAQYFPLYYYDENSNTTGSLFDIEDSSKYIRRDGISDWILKQVRSRFGNTKTLTKEHIFYYVYGLLHSKQYCASFVSELKKSLPRIPIADNVDDFMKFYKTGKELADLHLNYEKVPACPEVTVEGDNVYGDEYDFYAVQKMRFPAKDKKDTIIYNGKITINNIPAKAYEYIVNGKSAMEWIMERYQITVDDGKNGSMIKNDPNDWSREHSNPRYILDLLLSVINLSIKTVDLVNGLPEIKME